MATKITVRAPSSTANLGPGFDTFGLAIDAFYDEITLTKRKKGITIITDDNIPTSPENNTAGLVVKNMKKRFKIKSGIEIKIKKGIPAGFGIYFWTTADNEFIALPWKATLYSYIVPKSNVTLLNSYVLSSE